MWELELVLGPGVTKLLFEQHNSWTKDVAAEIKIDKTSSSRTVEIDTGNEERRDGPHLGGWMGRGGVGGGGWIRTRGDKAELTYCR